MNFNFLYPILISLFGYLFGSLIFGEIFMRLFKKQSLIEASANSNPGTENAYKYGGFWCGTLTVLGDLAKGAIPVLVFLSFYKESSPWFVLILIAPVLGHALPIFNHFKGGMCIATSFGVLIGLAISKTSSTSWVPLVTLFLLFVLSFVFPKLHNSKRTILIFTLFSIACIIYRVLGFIVTSTLIAMFLISLIVINRMNEDLKRQGLKERK